MKTSTQGELFEPTARQLIEKAMSKLVVRRSRSRDADLGLSTLHDLVKDSFIRMAHLEQPR